MHDAIIPRTQRRAKMTNPIYDTYKPPGFHTISVYMSVENPQALIGFLEDAFFAKELQRTVVGGKIRNCILQMGDSCFMVSPCGDSLPMPGQFYLFVNDPDVMVKRAVQHGATQVMKVDNMSYGDRQGGVKDIEGNIWWISKRIKEEPYPQEHE